MVGHCSVRRHWTFYDEQRWLVVGTDAWDHQGISIEVKRKETAVKIRKILNAEPAKNEEWGASFKKASDRVDKLIMDEK